MKIGDKVPCVLEIVAEVEDGEKTILAGESVELNNVRRNKWWAVPFGQKNLPRILICYDPPEGEMQRTLRESVVSLIESTQ